MRLKDLRLGYPKKSKIVIINIDDLGEEAVNDCVAIIDPRIPKSFSILTTAPAFKEAVQLANYHSLNIGLHLDPKEIKDIEKQINCCLESGINLTHMDSHKHIIYENDKWLTETIEMSHKYKIPLGLLNPYSIQSSLFKKYFGKDTFPHNRLPYKSITIDDYCYTPHYFYKYHATQTISEPKKSFFEMLDEIRPEKITVIAFHPMNDQAKVTEWNDLLLLKENDSVERLVESCCLTTWKELESKTLHFTEKFF